MVLYGVLSGLYEGYHKHSIRGIVRVVYGLFVRGTISFLPGLFTGAIKGCMIDTTTAP